MTKTRVLLAGEFTGLSTGYGNYGRELLTRLRATGRYDVAEYSSYVHTDAPAARNVPWPVYGVEPRPGDERGEGRYRSNPVNQFGRLDFEKVLLDFRPQVVCSYRDPWMDSHVAESPFRRFYGWCYSPTVDSEPQENAWLSLFASADAILTYTEWAGDVLRAQSGGLVNSLGAASPVPDNLFVPPDDKRLAKERFGLDPNGLVVGYVSRNQPRKLIPDLFESFAGFLDSAPPELAKRTSLFLHTTYPDVGHDIPELLKEHGLLSKCLFTYLCLGCGLAFPSFFQSAKTICPRCGGLAMFPSTRRGVTREQLRDLYWTFDAYVQYATAEGMGMGQTEAAACGVPVFAVDYSAMGEVARKLDGFPVRVQRRFRDHGTNARRALPDNSHLVDLLVKFLSLPTPARAKKGFETRMAYELNYSWDKTVSVWDSAIQGLPPPDRDWGEPPSPPQVGEFGDENLPDEEWLVRGIIHGAGRPDLVGGYFHARVARDLAWGCQHPSEAPFGSEMSVPGSEPVPYGRREALHELLALRSSAVFWEEEREKYSSGVGRGR
jgi:glycosyltransferase involved in cell wall biosynthesis